MHPTTVSSGPHSMRQGKLAAGPDGQLTVVQPDPGLEGGQVADVGSRMGGAHGTGGGPAASGQIHLRKRRQTGSGPVYEEPSSSVVDPASADEPEARLYKKHLRSWTPVLTDGPHQPVEPRSISFITTEHLHSAMGTSEQDRRALSLPSKQGAGFVLKLEKWDLGDPSVAAELINVYDLPPD